MPPVIFVLAEVAAGITASVSAAAAASGLVSFASIGAFIASPIGALVVGIGLQLLVSVFTAGGNKKPPAAVEASKVNVKVAEPERWLNAGECRQGGGVLFAEFDDSGAFWYLVVHSDAQLKGIVTYYFDDIPIEITQGSLVYTDDFCLDPNKNAYNPTSGLEKQTYFQIWTTTYTDDNPTPPPIAEFVAAFPGVWTADHRLVGTTYSVIKILPISGQNRYKIYRWRGPVGIGEPAVSIAGQWSAPYDPRIGKYQYTRNAVLIWAWWRTHRYGRGKDFDSINWDKIKEQADICDQSVTGVNATQARYMCGISAPESKQRVGVEQEILLACDGQIVFDDDGKCWVRVGYYYRPTLELHRNRDIVAMESVEAQNGESETQGVIVRYTDPSVKYGPQPCAPWINPLYYVEGEVPKYLTVDALSIQNENQAIRLAKSIGMRSQPEYKLAPTAGLRGIKARQERIIYLNYDNSFSGDHEIVTPVELDENGLFTSFGLVPVDQDRWNLLAGEERVKSTAANSQVSIVPELLTEVIVSYNGAFLQAQIDVDAIRPDYNYDFQYKMDAEADSGWRSFENANASGDGIFSTAIVLADVLYNVRWRTRSSAGVVSDWSPVEDIYTHSLTLSTGIAIPTTGTVGVAYTSWTLTASGGSAPYEYEDLFSKLPPGITINMTTGLVSGTPTIAGSYADIVLRAKDSLGAVAFIPAFTITIS